MNSIYLYFYNQLDRYAFNKEIKYRKVLGILSLNLRCKKSLKIDILNDMIEIGLLERKNSQKLIVKEINGESDDDYKKFKERSWFR